MSGPPGGGPSPLDADRSFLLVVDLQERLMPAIEGGAAVVANAARLAAGARLLGVPVLVTEQNPAGLGPSVPEVRALAAPTLAKTGFDAGREPGFAAALPAGRPRAVLCGAEAHVCVLQTALGLLASGRPVAVVRDAVGSRRGASREAALHRLAAAGADLVTAEMVLFEWVADCRHPAFREVLALVK